MKSYSSSQYCNWVASTLVYRHSTLFWTIIIIAKNTIIFSFHVVSIQLSTKSYEFFYSNFDPRQIARVNMKPKFVHVMPSITPIGCTHPIGHTSHVWHHPSASSTVIVWKVVDQHHLFLNILPNNLTAATNRKVWCDRSLMSVCEWRTLSWACGKFHKWHPGALILLMISQTYEHSTKLRVKHMLAHHFHHPGSVGTLIRLASSKACKLR